MTAVPKPYRRKKRGRYVGNFRVTVAGEDLNLGTKDANEATRRARLAAAGKWPPVEAAAEAAAAALDPGAAHTPTPEPGPEPPIEPAAPGPPGDGAPAGAAATPAGAAPTEPLGDAARAAAADASADPDAATNAAGAPAPDLDGEIRRVMGDLGVGGSADLFEQGADGIAALLLWLQGKAIELGIEWRLKVPEAQVPQIGPSEPPRTILRLGVKAQAMRWFPNLLDQVQPWMAIVVGLGLAVPAQVLNVKFIVDGRPVTLDEARAAGERAAAEQKRAA